MTKFNFKKLTVLPLFLVLVIFTFDVEAQKRPGGNNPAKRRDCRKPGGDVGSQYRDENCNWYVCKDRKRRNPKWVKSPPEAHLLLNGVCERPNCVRDLCNDDAIKFPDNVKFPDFNETDVVPATFKPLISKTYVVDGVDHAQYAFYDDESKEAIVHVPAHAGFDPVVSVITSKDQEGKAKILSCQNEVCDFNNLPDELNMNVENILHDLKIRTRTGGNQNFRQQVQNTNVQKIFTVRSHFRELTDEEYGQLTPSMIEVANGHPIFTSDIAIETEETAMDMFYPIQQLEQEPENHRLSKRQAAGCQLMYGCQDSWTRCGWGYTPLNLEVVTPTTPNVHNYDTRRYCVQCQKGCHNPNYQGLQMKCDDIVDEQSLSLAYYASWRDTCIRVSRYNKYCENEPNPYGNRWFGMCMHYNHNCNTI